MKVPLNDRLRYGEQVRSEHTGDINEKQLDFRDDLNKVVGNSLAEVRRSKYRPGLEIIMANAEGASSLFLLSPLEFANGTPIFEQLPRIPAQT